MKNYKAMIEKIISCVQLDDSGRFSTTEESEAVWLLRAIQVHGKCEEIEKAYMEELKG